MLVLSVGFWNVFLGPAVGSWLYSLGGFILPFLIVGLMIMISSIGTILLMPKGQQKEKRKESPAHGKKLTFTELLKVSYFNSSNFSLIKNVQFGFFALANI